MFCNHCGKQNEDGVNFCLHCGARLEQPGQEPPKQELPKQEPSKEKTAKPKKKKKTGLIITAVVLVLVLLGELGVYLFLKNREEEVTLSDLTADSVHLVADHEETILFTVKVSQQVEAVDLYLDDEAVEEMYDDGKAGDAEEGDGIYSCQISVKEAAEKVETLQYYCKYKKVKSDPVNIYIFPMLDEAAAREARTVYENLAAEIGEIESEAANAEGYVPADKQAAVIEEIVEELEEAKEDETVLYYQVEDNTVFIKMTSGLSMVYAPKEEGVDAVGSDTDMTIITLQPCYTEMGGSNFGWSFTGYALPEGVEYILQMLDAAARDVKGTLPNYSFPNSMNRDDEAVTLETVRSIGANQIILWHGHGGYNRIVHSYLLTGEPFDWNAWWWDWEYFCDCVADRILESSNGYACISAKYIEKYCGDMDNTFIYLAACMSGKDSVLADAFTNKGAAVVANTESILRTYNVAMLYGTVEQMLKVDPATGEFYTLQQALANAKEIYGDSDADSRYGGDGAAPLVFGGEDARNYRLADEVPTGTISGKVCKASDRITPIGNAEVEVFIDGTSFKKLKTTADGQYSAELPIGECTVKISADGYITFNCYATVKAGDTIYMETFLMVAGDENQTGTASGSVINSLSGQGVEGVQLTAYKDWNSTGGEAIKTLVTGTDGAYSVELPCGNYTLVAKKDGYSDSFFNIVVQQEEGQSQDGTITPVTSGNDYLITLTWDENPRDVDAHMEGSYAGGGSFHVYYRDMAAYENGETICSLDYDDRYSYGPEHITLSANSAQPYYYYLHHYEGTGYLATSGAKVTIEQGNRVLAEFHVPTDLGSGDYWNVFAIKDGEILVGNTITSGPDTTYAN